MKYVFIDESGDLSKHGSRYFITTAVATEDPDKVRKIMKRFRERRLKKSLKERSEIKANNSTPEIRKYILEQLMRCECEIYVIATEKSKILSKFDSAQDKFYHFLCKLLLGIATKDNSKTVVIIDLKDTNRIIKINFKNYIEWSFKSKGKSVDFNQVVSHSDNGLQIADFVAWAVHRKFNSGEEDYFNIIKSRIKNIDKMEMWKNSTANGPKSSTQHEAESGTP